MKHVQLASRSLYGKVQCSGGSKGGPNSFNFMQFLECFLVVMKGHVNSYDSLNIGYRPIHIYGGLLHYNGQWSMKLLSDT